MICYFLRKVKSKCIRVNKKLIAVAFNFAAVNDIFCSVYYFIFSKSFNREHIGVLNGIAKFRSVSGLENGSSALLRRNIHRLEKGLIMRPRRDIFALAYISETFEAYKSCLRLTDHENKEELNWARDVLCAYFNACAKHNLIDQLRSEFNKLPAPKPLLNPDRSSAFQPYKRNLKVSSAVNYKDLLSLAKRRRSVRWFLPQQVPRHLVEKAVLVAGLSPSACNRQPFEFRFFDDETMLRVVSELPGGTAGYDHNFPLIGVVIGSLAHFFDERDRHLIYIDGSLATMSLVLALESLGLSSCCINWPDMRDREEKARKVLGLKEYERPVMFLAIGFPDPEGLVPYSQKKTTSQLCRWNYTG